MTVSITRSGGRTAPPDRERLEIADDGAFTMWRSVRSPVVGRFEGRIDDVERARVRTLAKAAAALDPPVGKQLPGTANETVTVDGATLRTGSSGGPDGPWGELVEAMRTFLRDLIVHPAAAIALDAAAGKLVHRGDAEIDVDLDGLSVKVVVWGPGWEQRGQWTTDATGRAGRVTAGPGWSYDLPFDHGLTVTEGDALHVFARFGIFDGDAAVAALAGIDPSPAS